MLDIIRRHAQPQESGKVVVLTSREEIDFYEDDRKLCIWAIPLVPLATETIRGEDFYVAGYSSAYAYLVPADEGDPRNVETVNREELSVELDKV